MTKFRTILTAVVAMLAIAAVVLPAAAMAKKHGKKNATKVTIVANGGDFSGTIKNKKNPALCANDREVDVYRMVGSNPSPAADDKIAFDTADHGQWNTGNTGANNGRYYAFAFTTPGCKAGISNVVQVTGRPEL